MQYCVRIVSISDDEGEDDLEVLEEGCAGMKMMTFAQLGMSCYN